MTKSLKTTLKKPDPKDVDGVSVKLSVGLSQLVWLEDKGNGKSQIHCINKKTTGDEAEEAGGIALDVVGAILRRFKS